MNLAQKILTTLLALGLTGAASAETLRGEVYQVTSNDVYVEMADTTVARVPVETANFYVRGDLQPSSMLKVGQQVVVDYEPVYGFQKYYYSDADVPNPNLETNYYLLQDVDVADYDYVEYEGRVYKRYPVIIER
jgi:hypothetical protein